MKSTVDFKYDREVVNTFTSTNIRLPLEALKRANNKQMLLIDKAGRVGTIRDFFRDKDHVIVIKGSFNPIHNGHTYLFEAASRKYPYAGCAFAVSFHTAKGNVTVDELSARARLINKAGYPVIISKSGYFYRNAAYLRKTLPHARIIFPLGIDALTSLLNYFSPDEFKAHFEDVIFEYLGRPGSDIRLPERFRRPEYSNINFLGKGLDESISSSLIRNLKAQNRREEIEKLMPVSAVEPYWLEF